MLIGTLISDLLLASLDPRIRLNDSIVAVRRPATVPPDTARTDMAVAVAVAPVLAASSSATARASSALFVLVLIYLVAALADFLAPYEPDASNPRFTYAPPQRSSVRPRCGGRLVPARMSTG